MNKINVSVAIATYNRSELVQRAVLAAYNQTFPPYEIVVFDDCSTDNTFECLLALRSIVPILKVFKNRINSGGVINWNNAVNMCQGSFIAWCSDDDEFLHNHLELAMLNLDANLECKIYNAGFREVTRNEDIVIDGQDVLIYNKKQVINEKNIVRHFADHFSWYFHPSTLVFHRDVWAAVGEFNPKYALADTDWFIRCANVFSILYNPSIVLLSNRHNGSQKNWSTEVGSVKMQKELRETLEINVFKSQNHKELDGYNYFKFKYFILLMRIYISRSRAGYFKVANEVIFEVFESIEFQILRPLFLFKFISRFLRLFQLLISLVFKRQRNKYNNFNKYMAP